VVVLLGLQHMDSTVQYMSMIAGTTSCRLQHDPMFETQSHKL
jgi:hypothetical protein